MSGLSSAQKKEILSDPATQFIKKHPQASKDQIMTMAELIKHYSRLKKQHKNTQDLCKKISRQIGAAKREKKPVQTLLLKMQEQSKSTHNLKQQLNDVSNEILGYFNSIIDNEHLQDKPPALPTLRKHSESKIVYDQISIKLLTNEDDAWNQYIEANPAASLYHRAEWKHLIHDTFGHESYYFFAISKGEIIGVLPLIRLNSRIFGDFMVSMPYFNSGGTIANDILIEQKLITTANAHAKQIGSTHIEYRDDIARDEFAVRTDKVNMILALPDSSEILWQGFSAKLRSQIKRSKRENPRVSIGGIEYLDDFYHVFAKNMRDLGTPVYGKSFFSKILHEFSSQSRIIVIHLNNKPVSAAFLLGYKDILEIPWASTIKEVNHLSINMLLYWKVLEFAVNNHYKYFDFGRSSKDAGTYRFKQQWGAQAKQLYWHYWLSDDVALPKLNPDNPKYALAINIWKRIPVFITKWIGPLIVKNLP